jgi:hypothetical protein
MTENSDESSTSQPFDTSGDAWNSPLPLRPKERGDGLMAVRHRLAIAISVAVLVWLGEACSFVFRERMCSPGNVPLGRLMLPIPGERA